MAPYYISRLLALVFGMSLLAMPVSGQSAGGSLALTLDEAVEIALTRNYTIRSGRLDVTNARAQVREAWGQVMPQVDVASSYTRNLKSPNPFAGSEAGGLFMSFGFIDWLSYNERARTDNDPSTEPIDFGEFNRRRQEGLDLAGVVVGGGGNPFAVDNQFQSGISISQTLFSGSALAAIRGAERFKRINEQAVVRQEQLLVDQVRRAFYATLLAEEQSAVVTQSVSRTQVTLRDMTQRVSQGLAPKFQRLSAEVELANLETRLVEAENQAALASEQLKLLLGVPVELPLRLRGSLEANDQGRFLTISTEDAVGTALQNRPDLDQVRLAVDLRKIDRDMVRAQFYPTVSAFANLSYLGSVPDNRSMTISDPDDPFAFTASNRGFFNSSYWNPSVFAGLQLSWNLFNGKQTSARIQQRQVAIQKAELDAEFQLETVRQEVQAALRNLDAARTRILSQEQNVERAELNYEYAISRLREGVASPLEERNASEQLDLSRLNYYQAVHDFLSAQSAFQTAVGIPHAKTNDFRLTRN